MPTVQIKYSTTAGNEPTSLLNGQLAINIADSILYWKDSGGVIRSFAFLDPVAPTLGTGDNSNAVATTAFVHGLFSALLGNPPTGLNTLEKLATAVNNDANFAQTVFNSLVVMIRSDQTQGLSAQAQKQAQVNIGLPSAVIDGGTF